MILYNDGHVADGEAMPKLGFSPAGFPPRDLCKHLVELRREGRSFDEAWPVARSKLPPGWVCIADTNMARMWRRAYDREPATKAERAGAALAGRVLDV